MWMSPVSTRFLSIASPLFDIVKANPKIEHHTA